MVNGVFETSEAVVCEKTERDIDRMKVFKANINWNFLFMAYTLEVAKYNENGNEKHVLILG